MSAPCEYAITPLYGINNRANNIKIVINTIIIGRPKHHFVLVASFCPFVGKNVANIGFYARKKKKFHPYATIIPPSFLKEGLILQPIK